MVVAVFRILAAALLRYVLVDADEAGPPALADKHTNSALPVQRPLYALTNLASVQFTAWKV